LIIALFSAKRRRRIIIIIIIIIIVENVSSVDVVVTGKVVRTLNSNLILG